MKERNKVTKLRGKGSFTEVFCVSSSKRKSLRRTGAQGKRRQGKSKSRSKRPKPILVRKKAVAVSEANKPELDEKPLSKNIPAATSLAPERPKEPRRRRRYSAAQASPVVRHASTRKLVVNQEDKSCQGEEAKDKHIHALNSRMRSSRQPRHRSGRTRSTDTVHIVGSIQPLGDAERKETRDCTTATVVKDIHEVDMAKNDGGKIEAAQEQTTLKDKRDLVQKMARIKKNWDTVRAVAKAAVSLRIMSSTIQQHDDVRHGIQGYSRFRRIIDMAPNKRFRHEQEFLMKATAELPFFKGEDRHSNHVTPEQIYELCRIMHFETFPEPGSTVFEQGEESRNFYIIVEGSVSVNVCVEHDENPQIVAVLTAGMTFGENAINRSGGLRSATIVTEEASSFITISNDDFMRILCAVSSGETKDAAKRFAKVQAFQDLSAETLQKLASLAKLRKLGLQDEAGVQGSPIDQSMVLMVIKRGEVMVQRNVKAKNKKGEPTTIPWTLCILGQSEVLSGEPNFMQQTRHNCSFVANTLVELYTFSKHELFSNLSEVELRHIQSRLQPFPPLRYTQILYEAALSWETYKRLIVKRVTRKTAKQCTHGQLLRELRKRIRAAKPTTRTCTLQTTNSHRRPRKFLHDRTELDALFIDPKDLLVIEEFAKFTEQLTRQVYNSACSQSSLHFHFARPYLSKHALRRDAGSKNSD